MKARCGLGTPQDLPGSTVEMTIFKFKFVLHWWRVCVCRFPFMACVCAVFLLWLVCVCALFLLLLQACLNEYPEALVEVKGALQLDDCCRALQRKKKGQCRRSIKFISTIFMYALALVNVRIPFRYVCAGFCYDAFRITNKHKTKEKGAVRCGRTLQALDGMS